MELTYPMAIYIVIGAILLILLLTFKRNKPAFKDGKRSANTEYVKSLPQYKLLSLEFGVLKILERVLSFHGKLLCFEVL